MIETLTVLYSLVSPPCGAGERRDGGEPRNLGDPTGGAALLERPRDPPTPGERPEVTVHPAGGAGLLHQPDHTAGTSAQLQVPGRRGQ